MSRLLLFHALYCIALMHCTIYLLAHMRSFTLDRVESEPGVQAEQAQVEAITNLDLDQGKPRCIPPIILGFSFNIYNYVLLDCAFKFIGVE
jgi:hypothetical protein